MITFLKTHSFIALAACLILSSTVNAQKNKTIWFPEERIFPTLKYDLMEAQVYSGIFYLKTNKMDTLSSYVPVNLGLDKTLLQWKMADWTLAAVLGAASYTQFEIELYDQNTLRGGLLNTDFKASGYFYARHLKHHFRLQVFHRSSHLGDDYMLWNKRFELNDKSLSYEQADLIYLYSDRHADYYAGIGYAFSPYIFRERFMMQAGVQTSHPLNTNLNLEAGLDLKVQQETHFFPELHGGAGISFNRRQKTHMIIGLDAYLGYLPYSTLDYGKLYWLGASAKLFL